MLEKRAQSNIKSLLDFYTGELGNRKYVILQEYVELSQEGDIRVLMLNGEAIGAMRRVPQADDLRSNVHAGGSAVKHIMSKREKEICRFIGPKLVHDGIFFAGIDLIGDKLIEINVVSPGGIVNINRLNKTRLEKVILDALERQFRKNEGAFLRKLAYKKEVEDSGN